MNATANRTQSPTPAHRLTRDALDQAKYLADIFAPTNDPQREAQKWIYEAVQNEDLYQTIEAIRAANKTGPRGRELCTQEWRQWAASWLDNIDKLIFQDIDRPGRRTL